MKKKNLFGNYLIFGLVLVIIIVLIIVFTSNKIPTCGNGVCDNVENTANCPTDCTFECRGENDSCTIDYIPCCTGLTEVPMAFPENGQCIAASCGSICRSCGDGICQENENVCNCELDCE